MLSKTIPVAVAATLAGVSVPVLVCVAVVVVPCKLVASGEVLVIAVELELAALLCNAVGDSDECADGGGGEVATLLPVGAKSGVCVLMGDTAVVGSAGVFEAVVPSGLLLAIGEAAGGSVAEALGNVDVLLV